MNIDQLATAADVPSMSFLLWGAAAVILCAGALICMSSSASTIGFGLLAIAAGIALSMGGANVLNDARYAATESSFHAELEKSYGMKTDATLGEVKSAARKSGSVLFTAGSDVIEVRPFLNGQVLTFLTAEDRKVIERTS